MMIVSGPAAGGGSPRHAGVTFQITDDLAAVPVAAVADP